MKFLLGAAVALAVASGAEKSVDFAREVQPLLLAKCGSCHMGEKPQAGLTLHTRADILKGGENGPAVIPLKSRESLMIQRVTGFRAPVMPMGGDHLTEDQINLLRSWIDQGAQGSSGPPQRPGTQMLALRRPQAPASSTPSSTNPIDRFLEAYFRRQGIDPPSPVEDAIFLRRAYLDLSGLPASPQERIAFLGDSHPDKRERLIDALLDNRKNYSEHWISFWNDLLRNDEGVVYHGARQSITSWLLKALEDNIPYDRFVSTLLNPAQSGDPAGFLLGVNWRGDVSASQIPPMQAAQNSAQVFLGVNLKCNSCHDSFISSWKLRDAYGMASFFAEQELEISRCDAKTGVIAKPKFLYPELGEVAASASLAERRAAAARLFTRPENGRFARTLVNRIGKRLLGRGLVEPVDDMDSQPWDSDLLDWLAADFVDHGYDLKILLRRVMTSRAYQLPAVRDTSPPDRASVFRGPLVRRLTGEQFMDSISAITGEWRVAQPSKAGLGTYSREWRLKSSPLTRALGRPIRDQVFTERSSEATTLQALELVNGATLANLLRRGALRILGQLPPPPPNRFDSGNIRAEKMNVDVDLSGAKELRLLIEDADSYDRNRVVAGWANAELISPGGITRLADLPTDSRIEKRSLRVKGEAVMESLSGPLPSEIVYRLQGRGYTRFRAIVGVDESSLKSDISPRVRFFVFTEAPDRHQLVQVGAETPVPFQTERFTAASLTSRIYQHGLGRDPTAAERNLAEGFLTAPGDRAKISVEGLEDLLWSMFLSPEFQYID